MEYIMIRMHRRVSMAVAALALMAVVLTGCTSEASNIGRAKDKNGSEDVVDTGFTLSTVAALILRIRLSFCPRI